MDYWDKVYNVLKIVFEKFKDKEIYLVGSLSLYFQGIKYDRLPHDLDFIIVSDEPKDRYKHFFAMCLREYKIVIDIHVSHDKDFKRWVKPYAFRDLEFMINSPTQVALSKMIFSERSKKHIGQLEFIKGTSYYDEAKKIFDSMTEEEKKALV